MDYESFTQNNLNKDYLVVGSNGFAQVAAPDYYEKQIVELSIIYLYLVKNYPVPEKFKHMAHYTRMSFPHDFGTYWEIVVIYDSSILSEWEASEEETQQQLHTAFWEWFNAVESVDLESEELTAQIKCAYWNKQKKAKSQNTQVIYYN